MEPESRSFRFLLLAVTCFMTLGSYFCIDLPTVLQSQLQGNTDCNDTSANHSDPCCEDCLGLTPEQYNALFATRSWTACFFVTIAGFLIDKMGNRAAGILFSIGIILGNSLFAACSLYPIKHSAAMFPLMLVSRATLGLCDFPVRIVQDRLSFYWFKDKELSLAFGVTLTASRIGSIANFLITPTIAQKFNLSAALFTGVFLCCLGFISTILVTRMDSWGVRKSGQSEVMAEQGRQRKVKDALKLCGEFWCIQLCLTFFYGSIMPFMSNSVDFLQDLYGFSKAKAAYTSGSVYYVSIIMSPIMGILADKYGGRSILATLIGICLAPTYLMLAFTSVPFLPYLIFIWMGFLYTSTAVAVWSSIALLVPTELIGLGLGFTIAGTGFGIGITNLIIGAILGDSNDLSPAETNHHWRLSVIPVVINAFISSLAGATGFTLDFRRGKKLLGPKPKTKEAILNDDNVGIINAAGDNIETTEETDHLIHNSS